MNGKNIKELSSSKIALMCKQMAMLLKGGVMLNESMEIMAENASAKKDKEIYTKLMNLLDEGMPLSKALEATERFPNYMVKMVAIGDTSGKLDAVLDSLYLYYERNEKIQRSVKNAIVYPLIMVAVMIFVIALLLIKALPIFAQVFTQVGAEMPAYLRALSSSGNAGIKFIIITGVIILAVFAIYCICKLTYSGEIFIKKIYENGFLTKKLAEKANLNKFAYAMAMLLSSGININEAVDMTENLTDSPKMRKRIAELKEMIENDEPLAASLSKCNILSGEYAAMLAVGEKAGKIDEMMNTVAQRSADGADEWIGNLIGGIEPTIVIIMSLVIGGILISVMMPLMNVMSSI